MRREVNGKRHCKYSAAWIRQSFSRTWLASMHLWALARRGVSGSRHWACLQVYLSPKYLQPSSVSMPLSVLVRKAVNGNKPWAFLESAVSSRVRPNVISFSSAISACEKGGQLQQVVEGLHVVSNRTHLSSENSARLLLRWVVRQNFWSIERFLRNFHNFSSIDTVDGSVDGSEIRRFSPTFSWLKTSCNQWRNG